MYFVKHDLNPNLDAYTTGDPAGWTLGTYHAPPPPTPPSPPSYPSWSPDQPKEACGQFTNSEIHQIPVMSFLKQGQNEILGARF